MRAGRILPILLLLGCADAGTRVGPIVSVDLETSVGVIRLALDTERAPITVRNFLAYVDAGFYDGTIIHRVIAGFVIQGGGFTEGMTQKPPIAGPIPLESGNGLKNVRGSIAMARTSNPNSATSQFFINLQDNPNLDYPRPDGHGYAVFGEVVGGMAVVDSIARVATHTLDPYQNVPVIPIVIRGARRVQGG